MKYEDILKSHLKYGSTKEDIVKRNEYERDRTAIINVYDGGFFKWICDNVVPSFTIPVAYRNYWKKDILFYPDVIKWMKWLMIEKI